MNEDFEINWSDFSGNLARLKFQGHFKYLLQSHRRKTS